MERPETVRRLGVLAPACVIYATTLSILTVVDHRAMTVGIIIATVMMPYVGALWALPGLRSVRKALLASLAPLVQWACLFAWVLLVRVVDVFPTWLMIAATLAPALLVLIAGGTASRKVRGGSLLVGGLWVIAVIEGALALPLATRLAEAVGVDTLAAVVVLFAPAGAFGAWFGILISALAAIGPRRVVETTAEVMS